MNQPHRRNYSARNTLDVLGEKVEANADQVGTLTSQVSKLADQMSQLMTAIGVANEKAANLTDRVSELEKRSEVQVERKEQNTFTFNQNTIGWIVAVVIVLFNLIANGSIRIGK